MDVPCVEGMSLLRCPCVPPLGVRRVSAAAHMCAAADTRRTPNGGTHGHRSRDIPSTQGTSIFRSFPQNFHFQLSVFNLTDAPPKQQETRSSGFGFQIICVLCAYSSGLFTSR